MRHPGRDSGPAVTPRWMEFQLLWLLALCLLPHKAWASTFIALDVPALTRGSDLVVHGRVRSAASRQVQGTGRIVTEVELSVDELLRGAVTHRSVRVVVPGGTVGDLRQNVSGAPELLPGEEVVLFLTPGAEGWRVTGLAQGAFRVQRSHDGRQVLARAELPEDLRLVDPLSLQPIPTEARTLDLQLLRAQVRDAAPPAPPSALRHAMEDPASPPPAVRTRTPPSEGAPEGHCLWWPGSDTLTFHSQQCMPGEPDCAARQEAVGRALQAWDEVLAGCTSLRLSEGAATASRQVGYVLNGVNENVILVRERLCSQEGGEDCWNHSAETLGLTTTTFKLRTGQLLDTDIELNAVAVFSQAGALDLQGIVTHELGHALGLAHSPDSRSTMYATNGLRSIDEGSRQALCTIYPPGAPAVDCVAASEPQEPPGGSTGCSAAGGGGGLLMSGLVALLMSRRRSRPQRG